MKISLQTGSTVLFCTVEWNVTLVPVSENLQYGSEEPPFDLWANQPVSQEAP